MKKSRRNKKSRTINRSKKSMKNSTGGSTSKKRKRETPNSAQQYISEIEVQNIIRILEEKGMTYEVYPAFFDGLSDILHGRDFTFYNYPVYGNMRRDSVMSMHEYNILKRNLTNLRVGTKVQQIYKLFYQDKTDHSEGIK
jgi:hypothetical protein